METLRDTNLENLHEKKDEIGEDHWKKALHVIKEINRTQQVAEILTKSTNNSDLKIIGHLMAESHESLRDLYEVSCPEVDLLVGCAMKQPGVLGARITGWLATEMLEVNKRVKLFRPFSYFDESFFAKVSRTFLVTSMVISPMSFFRSFFLLSKNSVFFL